MNYLYQKPYAKYTYYLLTILGLVFTSCITYEAKPLEKETDKFQENSLHIQIEKFNHLILKPIKINLNNGFSIDEVAIVAVLNNPDLKAIRNQRGIASAELLNAKILPNPDFSYDLLTPTTGETNAFGLGLNWELSKLVSRNSMIDSVQKNAESIDLMLGWHEWTIAQSARLLFIKTSQTNKMIMLWEEYYKKSQLFKSKLSKALNLNIIDQTTYDITCSRLIEIKNYLEKLRLNKKSLIVDLNRLLGIDPNVELNIDLESFYLKNKPSFKDICNNLDQRRLDLKALEIGYKSQESKLRATIESAFPRFSIGVLHEKDSDGIKSYGVGFNIDIPIFDRGQGKIAQETVTRQKLQDEYKARLFDAQSEAFKILNKISALEQQNRGNLILLNKKISIQKNYDRALELGNINIIKFFDFNDEIFKIKKSILTVDSDILVNAILLEIESGEFGFVKSDKNLNIHENKSRENAQ